MNIRFVQLIHDNKALLKQLLSDSRLKVDREVLVEVAQDILATDQSFAVFDDNLLVAGGGLVLEHYGRAHGWFVATKWARKRHIVLAARSAREFLDERQRHPCFHRVEIALVSEMPWARSFAAALGFGEEALMRKADPSGRDMRLYSRIAGDWKSDHKATRNRRWPAVPHFDFMTNGKAVSATPISRFVDPQSQAA